METIEKALEAIKNSPVYKQGDEFLFKAGVEFMKKEYEEKLKWVRAEEKLPETREYSYQILVRTKSSDRGSDLYRTVAIFSFDTQSTIERKIRGYIGWRYFL